MSRLFYNTINRCDIGGFQVASFLFINEWPKYFWRNCYYLSNFILFDGLRKGWLNANNIKIIIYILIGQVFQQQSILFSRSLSINFFLIDTISFCQHKSRNEYLTLIKITPCISYIYFSSCFVVCTLFFERFYMVLAHLRSSFWFFYPISIYQSFLESSRLKFQT